MSDGRESWLGYQIGSSQTEVVGQLEMECNWPFVVEPVRKNHSIPKTLFRLFFSPGFCRHVVSKPFKDDVGSRMWGPRKPFLHNSAFGFKL